MRDGRPQGPIARLAERGLTLPAPPPSVGAYASTHQHDRLLFVAGHTSRTADRPALRGVVGLDIEVEVAAEEARKAALNLLAAAHHAVGLDAVEALVQLRGFVRAAPDFDRHPAVVDGASLLLAAVLDGQPPHARAAVGVASLPGGACVELEAVFALRA